MSARLVVYFPLADPSVSGDLVDLYADCGVDVVECGWPAREPYLDGPEVRASMARALAGAPAAALSEVCDRLARRSARPKVLVMTYAEADHPASTGPRVLEGCHGVLVAAPPRDERRATLERRARSAGLFVSVFVPLPHCHDDISAAQCADGYVMLQAAPGLTGSRAALDPGNAERIASLRDQGIAAPILLGFGVSNGEQARVAVHFGADGVVVGSSALRAALAGPTGLAALLSDLRRGLDG